MADLTIEYYYMCVEKYNICLKVPSSDGTKKYRVEWVRCGRGGYGRFECECKGFQIRKTCRHVKEAEAKYNCGWHQQLCSGDPVGGKCPECKGEIKSVACGV